MTDGHVVLILLLQLPARRQLSLTWLEKSAPGNEMCSVLVNSILLNHINFSRNTKVFLW